MKCQTEKKKVAYVLTYMWNLKKSEIIETINCWLLRLGVGGKEVKVVKGANVHCKKNKFWGRNIQHGDSS